MPDTIRRVLPKIARELHVKKNVSSIGLFGSWNRGDAAPSSDLDILVVTKAVQEYEYIERMEIDGSLVDFDYVPRKWLVERLPTFLDQKIFEASPFFESDWTLTVAKNWIQKLYRNRGRIEIRTDALLLDAETYLSRIVSAMDRKDYESASLFIPLSVEPLAKILLDVVNLPFSDSRLLKNFRRATEIIRRPGLYTGFIKLSGLENHDPKVALKILGLLQRSHMALFDLVQDNPDVIKSIHVSAQNSIRYHSNPLFISGVRARIEAMVDGGELQGAILYSRRVMMSFFEDYAILVSGREGTKVDFPVLARCLKGVGEDATTMYKIAQETFDLTKAKSDSVNENVEFAREMIRGLRKEKDLLIDNFSDGRRLV